MLRIIQKETVIGYSDYCWRWWLEII